MRDKFVADYPYAKLSEFEFWIGLAKNGDIDEENTKIVYVGDGGENLYDLTGRTWKYSWDITSDVFKYKYSDALYWGPSKIWDLTTTTEPFAMGKGSFDPTSFRIFVNGDQSFLFNSTLTIKWSSNAKDITKATVDKNDPYFCSLIAANVVSQKPGIYTKHLQSSSDVHKVVTSLMQFYVVYNMKRFLRSPSKLTKYVDAQVLADIRKNLPTKKVRVKKYHQGKETISAWLKTQPNKANIRNARHYGGGIGGVIGIEYKEVDKVLPMDESSDWKKFIRDDSQGITKIGQLFLQKAAEAFVYSILGAQAQTRWKIVGDGAKSLQTQETFAKLVKDTVAQDDDKVLIKNMRTVVKSTNVVLNLVVLPGLILIPSDLVLLKEKIPGYNNTLTMATKEMSFGKNEGLNFDSSLAKTEKTKVYFDTSRINADKSNKELGVVFAVLTLVGAVGAWLW